VNQPIELISCCHPLFINKNTKKFFSIYSLMTKCIFIKCKIQKMMESLASITSKKTVIVMLPLSINDCPAELHLLPVLVKVKKILEKHFSPFWRR